MTATGLELIPECPVEQTGTTEPEPQRENIRMRGAGPDAPSGSPAQSPFTLRAGTAAAATAFVLNKPIEQKLTQSLENRFGRFRPTKV